MRRLMMLGAALALLAAACGDSGNPLTVPPSSTSTPASSTSTQASSTSTQAPATGGAVDNLQDVRGAVVQIVAKGTFQDPQGGLQANVPGSGSGFIIDESGLAVTNNHVVTGAALLEVFLDGEEEPRNARVVGVSECSDLAVIDIEGDGFPYLAWFDGEVSAGLPIFAAGFPLGDPEYTLLDGIISKENAGGETTWASVEAVIEHSADTLPGNSGGPILTADGQVVAVNYAGNSLGQSFAIGRTVALPIVESLTQGSNVDSLGLNGEALFEGGFSGIWVYSVESGSAADNAGVEAGDIVITMEDLQLALDGTMSEYCDIVRSHLPEDVLDIEVYRPSVDAVLAGQLNGRVLEPVTSFAADLDDRIDDPVEPVSTPGYTEYGFITDDAQLIEVSVPTAWSDVIGLAWDFSGDGVIGPALSAAPDRQAWLDGWGTPGVFIGASALLDPNPDALLDTQQFGESCTFADRLEYDDGLYFGAFDVWEDCGAEGSTFIVVAATPADFSFIVLVEIIVVTDADLDAADEIFNTFQIIGDLAG